MLCSVAAARQLLHVSGCTVTAATTAAVVALLSAVLLVGCQEHLTRGLVGCILSVCHGSTSTWPMGHTL
jgi:hypothetical protein